MGPLRKLGFRIGLHILLFQQHFRFKGGEVVVAGLIIHTGDDIGSEIDDAFEILGGQVQQVAQAGRHTLEVPNVGDRGRQFDMAHAFAAHLGLGDFHAAAFTNDALVAHPLIFAAGALPVPGGTENPFAEQAVLFGL